jgi:hypothetical protein
MKINLEILERVAVILLLVCCGFSLASAQTDTVDENQGRPARVYVRIGD